MNAMEHGNRYREDVPAEIRVALDGGRLWVRITDQGGEAPLSSPVAPDLEAKLAGLQSPRGWGLFLIERMVDELRAETDGDRHTLELGFDLEGDHARD
jgi:anti-sigma regulatory factor (Ser/Thr protein kinase)